MFKVKNRNKTYNIMIMLKLSFIYWLNDYNEIQVENYFIT